jgi:hypothetical protein
VIEGVTAFSIELSHQADQHGEVILTRSSHLAVVRGTRYSLSLSSEYLRPLPPVGSDRVV